MMVVCTLLAKFVQVGTTAVLVLMRSNNDVLLFVGLMGYIEEIIGHLYLLIFSTYISKCNWGNAGFGKSF